MTSLSGNGGVSDGAADLTAFLTSLPPGTDKFLALRDMLDDAIYVAPEGYFRVQTYVFIGLHAL